MARDRQNILAAKKIRSDSQLNSPTPPPSIISSAQPCESFELNHIFDLAAIFSPNLVYIAAQMSENGVTGPSPQPGDRVAIGITFGNSNSSIAYTIDDKAEVIANEDGGKCDKAQLGRVIVLTVLLQTDKSPRYYPTSTATSTTAVKQRVSWSGTPTTLLHTSRTS